MANDKDRAPSPSDAEINRGRSQGLGVGQQEMNRQRDPNRYQTATNPEQRSFEGDLGGATNADRPAEADFGGDVTDGDGAAERADVSRNEAGLNDVEGDLGAGTPPNVDVHKLGQEDNPEEDWGEPADEGTLFSSNHTRRAEKTEAERGQGAKTRAANKDIVSRRS